MRPAVLIAPSDAVSCPYYFGRDMPNMTEKDPCRNQIIRFWDEQVVPIRTSVRQQIKIIEAIVERGTSLICHDEISSDLDGTSTIDAED